MRGCYATALEDCGGRLSREHYFSDAILQDIAEKPVLKGIRGADRIEGAQNMVARVLCERHNNMLSPLDGYALRFVKVVRGFFPGMPRASFTSGNETHLFHAGDIARGVLKSLCATEAAGAIGGRTPSPRDWSPPEPWLKILFEDNPWPAGWGLYVPVLRAAQGKPAIGFTFTRRVDQLGRIVGADLCIGGLPFILLMADMRGVTDWSEPDFSSVHAHPSRVVVHIQGVLKTLEFGRLADGRDLTINHRVGAARAA